MSDLTGEFYASTGFLGYGSQLLVGNAASPEVFTAVAEVLTIGPGAIETADVNRTHLRSPDHHHEHMPGLRDSGPFELTGTLRMTHESQNNEEPGGDAPGGLIYLQRTRAIRNMQIKLSDDDETILPFRGYVQRFQIGEIGVTDKVGFTAAIMPTESYSAYLPDGAEA